MDNDHDHQVTFKPIPADLYHRVEPEAGQILPPLTGAEAFAPDWDYLLSGNASKAAVVAGLHCGRMDPPEHAWSQVFLTYCPKASALLADAGVSFETWRTGRAEAVLESRVAAAANTELDGFAVFRVLDVPAMVATIIAELGAVPRFD